MGRRDGWGVPLAEHPTGSRVCKSEREPPMPYALFEKETKLSRAFPTATDVWPCAEDCGLVVDGADSKPGLEDDYSIKPCAPDAGQDAERASDRTLQKT